MEQRDTAVEGGTHGHRRAAQSIAVAPVGDLVFAPLELAGEVFRQLAGVLGAEDLVECTGVVEHGAVGVRGVLRGLGEAGVVGLQERGQPGVGGVDGVDAGQAQFFDKPVLEGLIGPLDPPLGLRGMGVDGLDVEGGECARELRELALAVRGIDAEDAVLIGVQRHRAPMGVEIRPQGRHVGLGGLGGCEAQREKPPGGVVDEHDQCAARAPAFEPVMGRAVDLHKLAQRRPARSRRMDPRKGFGGCAPDPVGDHPLAQRLHGERRTMGGDQLLMGEGGSEVGVAIDDQPQRPRARAIAQGVVGPLAPVPRGETGHALHSIALDEALDLANRQAQPHGRLALGQLPAGDGLDDPQTVQLAMAQWNSLLRHDAPLLTTRRGHLSFGQRGHYGFGLTPLPAILESKDLRRYGS